LAAGEGEPKVAAEGIRQRPAAVREAILAALDEWDDLVRNETLGITEPHWEWLRAVLEAAEPEDAWSRKVRAARREADAGKRFVALEALANSAKVAELPARALTRLADVLRPVQKAALLRRAQRQYPADFWVNHNLGIVLERVTPPEREEAVRFLTAAVALRPESPGTHLNLGLALERKGQLDEAIACYKKAIELDPKYTMAHVNLGKALKTKGQLEEAIACYKKAIALDPKHVQAHGNLGLALKAKGRLDEAIACYKKVIALDPKNAFDNSNAIANSSLGIALVGKGQLNEAIACFRKAIELDPKFANAHNNLGNALVGKGQLNEAIACFRKAIDLDPKYANAHNGLGNALKAKGRLDEAIASYKKAIELDPKDAAAHNNLADILANAADPKLRNPVQAVAEAKKATELSPELELAWGTLGEAYYRNGQWQEAIAALDKMLALLKGDDGEIFFFLAMAHHRAGHKDEARKWYDKCVAWMKENAPKNPTLLRYRKEAAEVLGVK
jgi:superkiller protein 3